MGPETCSGFGSGDTYKPPSRPVPPRSELMAKSVKELKQMVQEEGYDPNEIVGLEKSELVDRLTVLLHNQVPEDPYPLPLYSNCMPQVILRILSVVGLQLWIGSYVAS